MKTPSKVYQFLLGMFPNIMLQNPIVTNIINIVGIKVTILKDKVDKTLNTDI